MEGLVCLPDAARDSLHVEMDNIVVHFRQTVVRFPGQLAFRVLPAAPVSNSHP